MTVDGLRPGQHPPSIGPDQLRPRYWAVAPCHWPESLGQWFAQGLPSKRPTLPAHPAFDEMPAQVPGNLTVSSVQGCRRRGPMLRSRNVNAAQEDVLCLSQPTNGTTCDACRSRSRTSQSAGTWQSTVRRLVLSRRRAAGVCRSAGGASALPIRY
jgi:hypothetical protein